MYLVSCVEEYRAALPVPVIIVLQIPDLESLVPLEAEVV